MAPESIHTAPPPAAGTGSGVPLIALVLSGALRLRHDGADAPEPPHRGD